MSESEHSLIPPDVATATPTREQAYGLVCDQYLSKGYTRAKHSRLRLNLYDGLKDTTTLIIENDNEVVRTLTLVPGGPTGLPADDLFRDILDNLRAQGRLGGPALCTSVMLSVGLVGTEVLRILLKRGTPLSAPYATSFDPMAGRYDVTQRPKSSGLRAWMLRRLAFMMYPALRNMHHEDR